MNHGKLGSVFFEFSVSFCGFIYEIFIVFCTRNAAQTLQFKLFEDNVEQRKQIMKTHISLQ